MMKKYIIALLVLFSLLALSGCGSDSKTNPIAETPVNPIEPTDPIAPINPIEPIEPINPIDPSVPIVDTTNYNFTALTNEINVSEVGSSKVLDFYLSDTTTLKWVEGQSIIAYVFDPSNGVLNEYAVTTDVNGHVAFNYTAPGILTVGTSFNITFAIDGGVPALSETVVVNFVSGTLVPPVDTATYVLQAVPSAINISKDDTSRVLDLYLSDTSINTPVASQVITAQFVDPNNGTMNQYTATTDDAGHVAFEYTIPEIFTVGNTFDIIFEVAGGTVPKSATVGVTFVTNSFNYALVNTTTPLLITYRGMEEEISVYVVDGDNVGVPGKTITITTIADGYGSVDSSTATTDASGKATFNYTAPDDITGLVGTSTVATLSFTENGTIISDNVTIIISSTAIISDYSLVNPAPTVDINNTNPTAVLDIQLMHTIDGNEIPVIDARPCETVENTVTIDCVIPEVIPREYGRIINAAGSNMGDGYIYFDYQGPDADEAATGIYTFEVYYIDENGEIAATNTLSVDVDMSIP